MQQHSLRMPCQLTGIGLHSGEAVQLNLLPAPENTGLRVRLSEGDAHTEFPAHHAYASPSPLHTVLHNDSLRVRTVEHLLAALSAMEVDNAVLLCVGGEIPALDGSAADFVLAIARAGRQAQYAPRRMLKVLKPVEVSEGESLAALYPSPYPRYESEIHFAHPAIGQQRYTLRLTPQRFAAEVARARTFGFVAELEALHSQGLALGGSLENAIGLSPEGQVLNPGGLRYPNEFVRHKLLDAVGDLALAGMPLLAHYRGVRASHRLHLTLLRALEAQPQAWRVITPHSPQRIGAA